MKHPNWGPKPRFSHKLILAHQMVVLEEMCPLTWATHITQDLRPTPRGVRDMADFAIFRPFFFFTLNGQVRGFISLKEQYSIEEPPWWDLNPGLYH